MKGPIWALFGNDEDGYYGSGTSWNPDGEETILRAIKWWIRNPAHNFTHHVIGIYGKDFTSEEVYSKVPGWTKMQRHLDGKTYPYWKYYNKWTFYFGWRQSGAFGMAFRKN